VLPPGRTASPPPGWVPSATTSNSGCVAEICGKGGAPRSFCRHQPGRTLRCPSCLALPGPGSPAQSARPLCPIVHSSHQDPFVIAHQGSSEVWVPPCTLPPSPLERGLLKRTATSAHEGTITYCAIGGKTILRRLPPSVENVSQLVPPTRRGANCPEIMCCHARPKDPCWREGGRSG